VVRDGRALIDGVVREPLPTRAASVLGGDVIIGVRLSPTRSEQPGDGDVAPPPRPRLLDIVTTMSDTMQEAIESHGSREGHLISTRRSPRSPCDTSRPGAS
jgi:predicted acylesterase/phospholipase RssA